MYENLKGKKLLVIGSEEVDVNIVVAAHELGVYVIAVDGKQKSENTPAKNAADESWDINYSNTNQIVEKCMAANVDGVIAGYSEFRVLAACRIARALGKPFFATEEQIEITRNKRKFKDECIKYNIRIPKDYCFNEPPTAEQIKHIHYPVIVKPTDYAGRKGVCVCYEEKSLNAAIDDALRCSQSKTVIVEEYIVGMEFSAIYSLSNGRIELSCFNEKYLNETQKKKSGLCELAISPSTNYLSKYIRNCDSNVQAFLRGIGAKNGVAFFQGIMNGDDFCIFEMGYRLNGGNDYVQTELNNNISYMKMLISFCLTGDMGDNLDKENPFFKKYYLTYIIYAHEGIVGNCVCNVDIHHKGIEAIHICPVVGQKIYEDGTTAQRAFSFKITADSLIEATQIMHYIYNNVKLIDENGANMLFDEFDTNRVLNSKE